MNTLEYLQAVQKKHGLDSQRKVARHLDLPQGHVNNFFTGRRTLDPAAVRKVAESLGTDPTIVVADIQLERSKRPEDAAVWQRAVDLLKQATAASLLAFVAPAWLTAPFTNEVATALECILC